MVFNDILIITDKNSNWNAQLKLYFKQPMNFNIVELNYNLDLDSILLENSNSYILIEINADNNKKILNTLKSLDNSKGIIILAADGSFASECFDINCIVDYLYLPVKKDRLFRAIHRLLSKKVKGYKLDIANFRFFSVGRNLKRINFKDIQYFEAYGIYSKVYDNNNSYILLNESFYNLELMLPKNMFLRVHRSFIINIDKIEGINPNNLTIGDKLIPIGSTFKKNKTILSNLFNHI